METYTINNPWAPGAAMQYGLLSRDIVQLMSTGRITFGPWGDKTTVVTATIHHTASLLESGTHLNTESHCCYSLTSTRSKSSQKIISLLQALPRTNFSNAVQSSRTEKVTCSFSTIPPHKCSAWQMAEDNRRIRTATLRCLEAQRALVRIRRTGHNATSTIKALHYRSRFMQIWL